MSDDDDDNSKKSSINASLGDLYLEVEGPDEEWVVEQFEKQWQERLEEADVMKEAIRKADRSAQ
jgi:hypothetical protein